MSDLSRAQVVVRLKMLHKTAEALASKLPTEEMYMEFSDEVVNRISDYIERCEKP